MNTALAAEPQSAGKARKLVLDELHRCGQEALSDIAELLTSELVTNALIHAHSQVTIEIRAEAGRVRISVADTASSPATPRPGSLDATTGRGLALVEALAADWGQTPTPDGKIVWFELEAAT